MSNSEHILKTGYLIKSPPFKNNSKRSTFKRWMRRFFVLYDDEVGQKLDYYEDEEAFEIGNDAKGSIVLKNCEHVRMQERSLSNKNYVISLATSSKSSEHRGRVFHLCAASEAEQHEWFSILESTMPSNNEEPEGASGEKSDEPTRFAPASPTNLENELQRIKTARNQRKEVQIYQTQESYQTPDKIENIRSNCGPRDSASSGYGSEISRRSNVSRTSAFSACSWSGEMQDIFEFAPVFVGPRISSSSNIRSFSTENLLEATEHDEQVDRHEMQNNNISIEMGEASDLTRMDLHQPSEKDKSAVIENMHCLDDNRCKSFPN